jgi:hypothetical protein
VSWPLYRLLMVLCLLPVLLTVVLVEEPELPPQPPRELTFDGAGAADKAAELLSVAPARPPGSTGDDESADLVGRQLREAGYDVDVQLFAPELASGQSVPMQNVVAVAKGRRPELIAVVAHRDSEGPGADDNASGTGVMLELASQLAGAPRERGLMFVSTDGGSTGGQGAAEFAESWPDRDRIVAAIVLDAVAAPAGEPVRILIRPDRPVGTSPTLYGSARRAMLRYTGEAPVTSGWFDQLTGYAVPYTRTEQGPLLARGIPALTLTAGNDPEPGESFQALDPDQLGDIGTATINLMAELDAAGTVDQGGSPALFLQGSVTRGRLTQFAMVLLAAPFLTCALDAAARCRRRRIALAPGLRGVAWRCSVWLAALVALWLLPVLPGDLASAARIAPEPGSSGLTVTGLAVVAGVALGYWYAIVRPRTGSRRPVQGVERTGGLVAAWLGLAFATLLLCAINPFALLAVLPAAHAWLWLPQASRGGRVGILAVAAAGAIGPLLILLELAHGQDLGLGALRDLLAMTASGYLSPAVAVCWALAAGAGSQVWALATGRYAPAGGKRLYN